MSADDLRALQEALEGEEFRHAVKLCGEITDKSDTSEEVAARVLSAKVYCFLQLNKLHETLTLIENAHAKEQGSFHFEKAYCLYRLNKFADCSAAIAAARAQSPERADDLAKLEAQVAYRTYEYKTCVAAYQKIDDSGALANLLASYVSAGQAEEAIELAEKHRSEVDESVELLFNLSCAQLALAKLGAARQTLETARALALAELAEDESADDSPEIAAIDVQLATVLQHEGRVDEANDIYTRVLKPRDDNDIDVTVLAVGCNNVVALRPGGKSLFDSLKRINVASKESLEHKLTRTQAISIAVNKCLLLLQGKKHDECRSLLATLDRKYEGEPQLVLVNAAVFMAEKKPAEAEKLLAQSVKKNPCPELVLALAELQAAQQPDVALKTLHELPEERLYDPGTLHAAVQLHSKTQVQDAAALLRRAMEWAAKREAKLPLVLELVMEFSSRHKLWELAADSHRTYLEQVNGADTRVLCRLVEALSFLDPDLAAQYAARLPEPDTLHLDAEEIEVAPLPKVANKKEAAAEDGSGKKAPTKRKRKPRYPKGFDKENPGPPPDPERWLPKHERAEFKKRMKKRNEKLARGPQGSTPGDDTAFRKKGPSTAQTEVAADTSRPTKKGRRNKK